MRLVIKKYQILTCFICLLLKAFPFFSKRIVLLLSWNKTLSWTWYPWASMKYWVQQIAGMKSLAPTISDSVELQVLSFCLVKLTMGNPLPKDRPPPLCPHMLGWTANAASTHHHGNHVPASASNFLSGIQSHKLVSTLKITTGSKQNGTLSSWTLTIVLGIFLMHLTVLSNLEAQVFLVVESLSSHNGLWAEHVGNSSLHWEEIEHLDSIEHNVYHQDFGIHWNSKLWQAAQLHSLTTQICCFQFQGHVHLGLLGWPLVHLVEIQSEPWGVQIPHLHVPL